MSKYSFKIPWNFTVAVGVNLNISTHIYTVRMSFVTLRTLHISVMDVEGKDAHLVEDQPESSGTFRDCSLQIVSKIYCEF